MSWHGPVRFDRWSLLAVVGLATLYLSLPHLQTFVAGHDTDHSFTPILLVPFAAVAAGLLFVIFRRQPGEHE